MVEYKWLPRPVQTIIVDPIGLLSKRHILTNKNPSYEYLQYKIDKILIENDHIVKNAKVDINDYDLTVSFDMRAGGSFKMVILKKEGL